MVSALKRLGLGNLCRGEGEENVCAEGRERGECLCRELTAALLPLCNSLLDVAPCTQGFTWY